MPRKKGSPATLGPVCGANCTEGGVPTGKKCGNPAGKGTDHLGYGTCWRHGGRMATHVKHAHREMAVEAAERFGVEVETTAEDALLGALSRSLGTVLFYRAQVQKLTPDQMVYGTERIVRTIRDATPQQQAMGSASRVIEDATHAKSMKSVWVQLLHEAERHHFEVARAIAGLKIERRRVEMAEAEGAVFHKALVMILARLGISADDPRLITVVPAVIEELTR